MRLSYSKAFTAMLLERALGGMLDCDLMAVKPDVSASPSGPSSLENNFGNCLPNNASIEDRNTVYASVLGVFGEQLTKHFSTEDGVVC